MSFPNYNRSLVNVSFADLAKYANNKQDEDISLIQCVDDLDGFGAGGTPSNVGLSQQRGHEKEDNFTGSSNNRKGRVNLFAGANALDGNEWLTNKGLVQPLVFPTGGTIDWGSEGAGSDPERFYRPSFFTFNSARAWLWCEEDTIEGPSNTTNSKVDRLMLNDNPTGVNEIGQDIGMLPLVHPLGTNPLVFASSGLDSTHISQNNVYGVPEGVTFANVSVNHRYDGSGFYWLWLSTAYRISETSNINTNSFGFNDTLVDGTGQWLGQFSRGVTHTTSASNIFQSGLRGLSNKLIGLEDAFSPDDATPSGTGNNFADFGIEMIVEVSVFI